MKKCHLFDGQTPESLTTIKDKNVAPTIIEDSMLNSGAKGAEQAKQFMKERLVRERGGKSNIPFSAIISKCKCPTFVNLFETAASVKASQKRVANESKNVLH